MAESNTNKGTISSDINEVRRFWNSNPLFTGESKFEPGEPDFFLEHESVLLQEHSGSIDQIFMQDAIAGADLLDVGSGIGFWVQQFCERGAKVIACDISEVSLKLTIRRMKLFDIEVAVQQGNAECLPYADGSFDHLNCQGVIHHTPDTFQCINEFWRVLKPDGTLCFSVYYKTWFLQRPFLFRTIVGLLRPIVQVQGRGRMRLLWADNPEELVRLYDGSENPIGKAFTRTEIGTMLDGLFEVREAKLFGFPRRFFPFPIPASLHRILSRHFGLMIVYRCQKIS